MTESTAALLLRSTKNTTRIPGLGPPKNGRYVNRGNGFFFVFPARKGYEYAQTNIGPTIECADRHQKQFCFRNSDAIAARQAPRKREGQNPSGKWHPSSPFASPASFACGALAAKLADFVCHCSMSGKYDTLFCVAHESRPRPTREKSSRHYQRRGKRRCLEDASHTFPVASWLSGTGQSPGHPMC